MYHNALLLSCFFLKSLGAYEPTARVSKRADVDLQTCINKFVIQRDKIIRTQDSKDMGAKYLSEIDLGSREECLRLCCETENCDVFVYEEKNSGSCYLFFCGPPEDFKCKFTHHVNYSSAVLTVNRHLPDLESQIKLTKHEQDLSRLRKPEMEMEAKPLVPLIKSTPSTTTTTVGTKEILPVVRTKAPEQERKCSRYQFECRSTGECIAIYNACDGIPQCTDASDEAPELGCPDTLPATPRPNTPTHIPTQNNVPSHPQLAVEEYPPIPQEPPARVPLARQEDFLRPVVPETRPVGARPVAYEAPQYAPVATQDGGWVPHQSNQMPRPLYTDNKNSNVFNHKESGLQVQGGQESSQMQYPEAGNGHDYPKMSNYYGDMYRPQVPPSITDNWPGNIQDDTRYASASINANSNRYIPDTIPREWHQQIPEQLARNMNYPPPQVAEKNPYATQPRVENPKHVQDKMADDLKQSKQRMLDESTPNSVVPTTTEKHENSEHVQNINEYIKSMAYKSDEKIEDEIAETPSGAVLTLTLGLIITFFTALLIGCRLRVVRKRMRRCGKSFAHDADYLVNGMYL